jgi:hypothetical protein
MIRFALALVFSLEGQMLHAQPNDDVSNFLLSMRERMEIAAAQLVCFKREASSASLANLDPVAAAHEVVERRCTVETERVRTGRARDFGSRIAEFEQWWRHHQTEQVEYIKELIAKTRAAK